jgi:hypothetical protein
MRDTLCIVATKELTIADTAVLMSLYDRREFGEIVNFVGCGWGSLPALYFAMGCTMLELLADIENFSDATLSKRIRSKFPFRMTLNDLHILTKYTLGGIFYQVKTQTFFKLDHTNFPDVTLHDFVTICISGTDDFRPSDSIAMYPDNIFDDSRTILAFSLSRKDQERERYLLRRYPLPDALMVYSADVSTEARTSLEVISEVLLKLAKKQP